MDYAGTPISSTSAAVEPASALTEEGQTRIGGDEVDAQEVIDITKRTADVVDAELENPRVGQ
jgi:hypothetical protein